MLSLLRTCLLSLAIAGAVPALAQTAPALAPADSFFAAPAFSGALLSPDARSLAVRVAGKNGRNELAVIELASFKTTIVAYFSDVDVGNFRWVNPSRLVFDTVDQKRGQGQIRLAPGLFAVDADGSQYRALASRSALHPQGRTANLQLPANTYMLGSMGMQDSDFIYVQQPKFDGLSGVEYVDLLRLNTRTGGTESVTRPGLARYWLLDQRGEPRIALSPEADAMVAYYRDPGSDSWRELSRFRRYQGVGKGFVPHSFGPDGTLYVAAYGGADKLAIYTYDPVAQQLGQAPLVKLTDYDFNGHFISNGSKVLGLHYLIDADETLWFDPAMKAHQARVDALLPRTVNSLSVAKRAQTPYLLVSSYSDLQPTTFSLFNTATQTLTPVGASRPAIQPEQMSSMELVHYKARDGLDIPAFLTLPFGKAPKKLPMVVLVHSGPYSRDSWGWKAQVQFLASRGYAVLEPQFRGSMGLGAAHFTAGWKQWGLRMQDDLADGARWAAAQGSADPQRICIAGQGYGGYAALMGMVNDPGLFKCAIDIGGITDFKQLLKGSWTIDSQLPEEWKQYGMPQLLGDPVKDAAQFEATSPLAQAARIKGPLLMAAGGADGYVPLPHAKALLAAVKASNPDAELVQYDEEGNGLGLAKNRIDFWTRVEQFLARHIGK
ncbi:MAG: alpha/beta fold hydrolase [Pseudomonadota bacterium]